MVEIYLRSGKNFKRLYDGLDIKITETAYLEIPYRIKKEWRF